MSKQHILSAVDFLRERLHEVFVAGVHATAPTPVNITPIPKPFIDQLNEIKLSLFNDDDYDLTHNQDGTPSKTRLDVTKVVLDNTVQTLAAQYEQQQAIDQRNHSAKHVADLHRLVLEVTRKVMPQLIAFEIIGVQPMKGPVDQINTLRVKYAETIVPKSDEALSPFQIVPWNEIDHRRAQEAVLEGAGGNRLSIQIMKEVVEAKTRKLAARWTFETAQDSKPVYDKNGNLVDIEAEIMAALTQEITAEFDQEMLSYLGVLPGNPTSTFDMMEIGRTPNTFVGDIHAALAILINRQANLIAARTRRGAGNWCVVSPTALTILQSATTSAFARTAEGAFKNTISNTKFVGTLNNSMKVYVNQYAADNTPVLVGYKGNEYDAAAFYAPYVPLSSSGIIIDPQTFEPVVSFMTRYGFLALTNSASSLGNAADYLGLVGIETNSLSFI